MIDNPEVAAHSRAAREKLFERARRGEDVTTQVKYILRDERPGYRNPDHAALVALRGEQHQRRREELLYVISGKLLDRDRRHLTSKTIAKLEGEHRNLQEAIKRATPQPFRVMR